VINQGQELVGGASFAVLDGAQDPRDWLNKARVYVEAVPFAPSNHQGMATATLEAFTGRQLDLYRHEQLIADLQGLRLEEKGYGTRLASPRGPAGHGDCATALALALHAARAFRNYRPPIHEGPVVWSEETISPSPRQDGVSDELRELYRQLDLDDELMEARANRWWER
jgi:hypothetical protein